MFVSLCWGTVSTFPEHRWPGCFESNKSRLLKGTDSKFKLFSAQESAQVGAGILFAECWADKVIEVQCISERISVVKLIIGKAVFTFLYVYTPQVNYPNSIEERFYDELQHTVTKVPTTEILIPVGNWKSHVDAAAGVYSDCHGGYSCGKCNPAGERVREFAVANGRHVGKTLFKKADSRLPLYHL